VSKIFTIFHSKETNWGYGEDGTGQSVAVFIVKRDERNGEVARGNGDIFKIGEFRAAIFPIFLCMFPHVACFVTNMGEICSLPIMKISSQIY